MGQRFNLVVEKYYDNNLAKAAMALGLDRSTLSRYVSGRQPPRSVLLLLSQLHDIDIDWLTDGTELKIRFSDDQYTGAIARPIIDVPCERVPDGTTQGFRGEFRQVAPYHNVPDRYWLRLSSDVSALNLLARDYILMQTVVPRQGIHSDLGCLRVLRRGEALEAAVAINADIKCDVRVVAIAHLIERDLK